MSSIFRFQMSGFKISVSTLAMRYWQRRLPFLYPGLHHGFVGRVFNRAGMNFLLSFELSLNQILRSISPIISRYGWHENENVQLIDFAKNFGTSQPQSNLPDSPRWGHCKEAKHILSTTPRGQISDQKCLYAPIIPLSVPGLGGWGFQLTSA